MLSKKPRVNTQEFKNVSLFSKQLRKLLKAIIIPRSAPQRQASYIKQFDQASRNVEITLERLGKLIAFYPLKAASILNYTYRIEYLYFSTQSGTKDAKLYDVYSTQDKKIPFRPEEDIMYTYMITQMAIIAHELAKRISLEEIKHIAQGLIDISQSASEAFHTYPTVMPRFTDHDRISLHTIQRLDAPLNCCPSIHIAYAVFIHNVAHVILLERFDEQAVYKGLEYATLRMFNSVLYTKQHALVDVAFGMLAAKISFEKTFPQRSFNDLSHEFERMQLEHPKINYNAIKNIYNEIFQDYADKQNFTAVLGQYLQKNNYPRRFLNETKIAGKSCG